jgi:hypothetical protein
VSSGAPGAKMEVSKPAWLVPMLSSFRLGLSAMSPFRSLYHGFFLLNAAVCARQMKLCTDLDYHQPCLFSMPSARSSLVTPEPVMCSSPLSNFTTMPCMLFNQFQISELLEAWTMYMFRVAFTLLPHLLRRAESFVAVVMPSICFLYLSIGPSTSFAIDQWMLILGVPPPFAVDWFAPGPG